MLHDRLHIFNSKYLHDQLELHSSLLIGDDICVNARYNILYFGMFRVHLNSPVFYQDSLAMWYSKSNVFHCIMISGVEYEYYKCVILRLN